MDARPAKRKGVTTTKAVMALGYGAVLAAVVPTLAAYDEVSWAMGATLLMVTGYSLSIVRALSPTSEQFARARRALLVVWLTYYALAISLPLPLHWYDSLVVMSLLVEDDYVAASLLVFYYAFSAAAYMGKQDALQAAGRAVLLAVSASAVAAQYNRQYNRPT